MACAGGFRSVVEQGLLYLSFSRTAPASAILSWSSAPHSRRGCRGARSQRTIKKSTKNKLRSAYPSPYRARSSFSRTRGALTPCRSACCNLSGVCVGANAALFHPLLPSTSAPSLSLSLSPLPVLPALLAAPAASPPPPPLLFPLFLVVCLG